MMPGQEPYTEAELAKLGRMLGAACEATEHYSEDELEAAAEPPTPDYFADSEDDARGDYLRDQAKDKDYFRSE